MDENITDDQTLAGSALELAGKSADEIHRTAAVDRADDEMEDMFDARHRTAASPLHRAVWDEKVPISLFQPLPTEISPDVAQVMDESIKVLRTRLDAGTAFGPDEKITEDTFSELAGVGFWGLLVDRRYGGSGAPFNVFAPFLAQVAAIDPTIAGMSSVHQCIGAVDPLTFFGTEEQKERFLPKLAAGERLSAFALTEPGAGSDLTALATTARKEGSEYVIEGEKLFITNAIPGRTVAVVLKIDDVPAVVIVDLPEEENEYFEMRRYGLHALRNAHNNGLVFKGLRVPEENLLVPERGDGLTIAYHGLNKGRTALCANAAGSMRIMAASMIPWAHKRETYGQPIATRELVQGRLGKLAAMIVSADALVEWTSWLLEEGFRGEMECIVAKVFGSEAEKEAAIELLMKTHGGRSFVQGHLFGDYVHDFLAPSIYEGEGEMLGMALFKSLVKEHGVRYFEPMGHALMAAGIRKPELTDPRVAWAVRGPAWEYGKWVAGRTLRRRAKPDLEGLPKPLAAHAEFGAASLQKMAREISLTMTKHQVKLPDRQARIAELSQRLIDATVMLSVSLYAGRQDDEIVQMAARVSGDTQKRRLTGTRPTDAEFRRVAKLGAAVAEGSFPGLPAEPPHGILLDY